MKRGENLLTRPKLAADTAPEDVGGPEQTIYERPPWPMWTVPGRGRVSVRTPERQNARRRETEQPGEEDSLSATMAKEGFPSKACAALPDLPQTVKAWLVDPFGLRSVQLPGDELV